MTAAPPSADPPALTPHAPASATPTPTPLEHPHARLVCPQCRYDLAALASAKCPECGMNLRVVRADPESIVDPAWRWGLAGLSFSALVGLLGLLVALGVRSEVLYFGLWTAVAAACILWWVARGRAMLFRQTREMRRVMVILCLFFWAIAASIGLVLIL